MSTGPEPGDQGQMGLFEVMSQSHPEMLHTTKGTDRTVAEARSHVLAHRDDGVACPVCGQFAKLYRRRLHRSMARALCWLVVEHERKADWVFTPEGPAWVTRSRELPKLRMWGLIEQKPNDNDPDKRCSGYWRPTARGRRFVLDFTTEPTHVLVYDGVVEGFAATQQTIVQALSGIGFSYGELMTDLRGVSPSSGGAT